jgi:hypothetical protein
MIRLLLFGVLTAAFVLASSAAARADDACWQLVYAAVIRDAAAPHAAYISYSELVNIQSDGHRYERASANITYRDDGIASIDDDRWARPFMSNFLEPGPPVLGPYGKRREDWLAIASREFSLPLIADVHNEKQRVCVDRGDEVINGAKVADIALIDAPTDRPALKEIWIDRRSNDIARVVLSGYLTIATVDWSLQHVLTDFSIDVEHVNGYAVVQRVAWTYNLKVYDQWSTLDAEYDFANYAFEDAPPPGTLFSAR